MALTTKLLLQAVAGLGVGLGLFFISNGALKLLLDMRDNNGNTLLSIAAEIGLTRIVRALVFAGADVNTQNNYGSSALGFASEEGHVDIVNILLDKGAHIEIRDNHGGTPLLFAAGNGQTDVVRALVSAGADVNTQRNNGSSALVYASEEGHVDIVNILLDKGAHIETRDNLGRTPLWFAAANGQTDVVRALVSAGANVNTQRNDGVSALYLASQEGHMDVVRALVSAGADVNAQRNDGVSALYFASQEGHMDVVRELVSAGADVNTQRNDGVSALGVASQEGHINTVNELLDNGAEIECRDDEGRTPLWFAACGGSVDIVNILLKHGADMHVKNNDNLQLMDMASYYGHVDIVQILTSCKSPTMALRYNSLYPPSVIHIDCHRNSALHLTTDTRTAMTLLKNGADVEAENVDGLRPIHCAVRTGLVELVELLIQNGANVDAADVFGNRPLHDAVCHGLDVVQLLVQHGAKLNVQNIDGKTPLHIAVDRQQSDVIVFLLNQDADVGLTDVWRNTPLHYLTFGPLAVSTVAESVIEVLTNKPQHLFIRNAVDVSVSMQITTNETSHDQGHQLHGQHTSCNRIVDSPTLVQTHNTNCLNQLNLDTDCHGNTALHCAVGVYGQIKMFKVSTDVTKTVELLVKRGADINAQNNDGLTPLHVARGEKAIEACLQHGGDQSFTITDKRGRNFWHLSFLTRTHAVELERNIRPMIAISDGKYSVDDLNRTPLHYACMNGNQHMASWNWLPMEFIKHFSVEHINRRDRFGRTALHYAAIGYSHELTTMLQTMKADGKIQDNYQKTSNEYMRIRNNFNAEVSTFQLMKSSDFIKRNHLDIASCVQNCFDDCSYTVKECKAKLHETVHALTGFCDRASYVVNTWEGCQYDYEDTTRRMAGALELDDQQRLPEQCHDFTMNNERATKPMTVFAAIQAQVHKAMKVLAKEITKHDHRFACEVIPVGSAHEGTKIGCCDEFDYNFVLTNLSSICEVCYSPASPPGFVLLIASKPVHDEHLKDLFDENGILNTRVVKFKFETLAKQVLSSKRFYDLTDFEFIDPVSDNSVGITPGNAAAKLNTHIKLEFTKPVNGYHVPHTISVDIVPVLHITDWWPETARQTELCGPDECQIVFTQPQSKYPWIGWTQPHGFISFARAESRLLCDCHPVAKAAYMAVKRMSMYFCGSELFASHTIKMALLWCLDKKDLTKYRSSNRDDEINGHELLCLVQNILRRLLCFAAQDYVPSYFMEKCHQPVWPKERYLKQFHTRLYQHGLTYKDLFSLNEQQSRDRVLQSIKSLFTYSHIMYWTVLSDTDDLGKLFVPSTINPLREISYDAVK